jgi:DNA-binding MurR/RpiR family transcriptional regulator
LLPDGVPEFRPEKVRSLPPTQRKIIEYMLEAGASSWTLSAKDLGAAVGTSGVNVVRAAQALGYSKLSHLRLALADHTAARQAYGEITPVQRMEATLSDVPVSELLERDVRVARAGLDRLIEGIRLQEFERAVELLDRSDRIVWRGIGPTAFLAQYAALHCRRIGHDSAAMTQLDRGLADELLGLQKKDALVILSYGGKERHTEVIISEAESKGADVVLVTDEPTEEWSDRVTMVLECRRGGRDQFQSHAVTMVLIESLILGVADRNTSRVGKSLARLQQLRAEILDR